MLLKDLINKNSVSRTEIADAIAKGNFTNLLLNAAPRTGKSVIASALMNKWRGKVLIMSNSINTNRQWKENINTYNPHFSINVSYLCYQSVHNVSEEYDIIICDEWETALSNKRYAGLMELKPKHWIAMSGSMDQWDELEFRKLVKNDLEYVHIGIEQVVKWGIIKEPKFFKVPVELDNIRRILAYPKGKDKKKKSKIILYPDRFKHFSDKTYNYLIQCTEHEYNSMIQQEYDYYKTKWEEDKEILFKNLYTKKGLERKKFYASVKPRHFRNLFSQLPEGSRCLVFCIDTAQADMLNEQFSVHSNKDNKDLIEQFRDGEIPYLFSVGMLNRGQDFENVDYVIILQVSGSNKENVQQIGRCFLSDKPKIIMFYLRGTDDEKYVNTLLSKYPQEWIKTKTL